MSALALAPSWVNYGWNRKKIMLKKSNGREREKKNYVVAAAAKIIINSISPAPSRSAFFPKAEQKRKYEK